MADVTGTWRLQSGEFAIIALITHIIALNAISVEMRHFGTAGPYWLIRCVKVAAFRPLGGKVAILARGLNSIIADEIETMRKSARLCRDDNLQQSS